MKSIGMQGVSFIQIKILILYMGESMQLLPIVMVTGKIPGSHAIRAYSSYYLTCISNCNNEFSCRFREYTLINTQYIALSCIGI